MTWIVLATFLTLVVVPVVQSLLSDEVRGWIPHLSRKLVVMAATRLGRPHCERYREEWLADLSAFADRPVTGLWHALQVLLHAREVRLELEKQAREGQRAGPLRRLFSRYPQVLGEIYIVADADPRRSAIEAGEITNLLAQHDPKRKRVTITMHDRRLIFAGTVAEFHRYVRDDGGVDSEPAGGPE
ncbi:MAG: hypothetical protein M3340_03335 [Actinomycetota bacterium]|nr:hypothetical protein [Actinomycetota bacterium]